MASALWMIVSRSWGTEAFSFRSGVGSSLGDLAEDLGAVLAVEGGLQGQELVEGHAQRIDVGAAVDHDALGQGLLGAHVPQRAQDVAGEGQAVVALDLGQAEVGDPEAALGVEQEVAGLDVAVEDAPGVGVVERLGRLEAEAGDVAAVVAGAGRGGGLRWFASSRAADPHPPFGHPLPAGRGRAVGSRATASGAGRPDRLAVPGPGRNEAAGQRGRREVGQSGPCSAVLNGSLRFQALGPAQLVDDLGEAAALDVLHRVERHAPLGADGEDRHDVVVVQAGGGLGLELEPLELAGVERRGHGQDLQRHAAVQRPLLGLVHDPHAAPADLAEDAVIAEDPGREIRGAVIRDDTSRDAGPPTRPGRPGPRTRG